MYVTQHYFALYSTTRHSSSDLFIFFDIKDECIYSASIKILDYFYLVLEYLSAELG